MKNKKNYAFVMLLAVGYSALPASAQKDTVAISSQKLQEVLVMPKSQARKLQEQAYTVSVVDLKDMYVQATPLNKILNNVSSVRLREDGGVGSNYTFAMNGFTGNQVKFFLDGIPMDNFGSSFNLANLSANMADHIEVFKGVLPVHLGADALGGAVNIVSRRNANYLDANYSIGSFNTHKASVNGAYTDMKTGFTLRGNLFFNYSKNDYKVFAPIVDLTTGLQSGDAWVKRFNDAVDALGGKRREFAPHAIPLRHCLAHPFGDVGHLVYQGNALVVEPLGYLLGAEPRQGEFGGEHFEVGERHADERQ